ncbi:MAG: hypothetical protein H0W65_02670 [Sphingomonas sp.]|uniref:hypothetical protein n=1 Tax=Sphingomonas sp. TaxID=28214 RepID=UPI00180B973F|nr:hypothetical protein [Sphingomonas sp.]MBA3666612.1 hypothetical protein [Sphingomonas sp.]
MTALRRMTMTNFRSATAASMIALAAPAWAQNTDAPIDVTAAPPPSAETVGPAQLRNFTLNGTVTRRADTPSTAATGQPAPTARPVRAAPSTVSPGTVSQVGPALTRPPAAAQSSRTRGNATLPAATPASRLQDLSGPTPGAVTQPSFDVTAPPADDALPASPPSGFPTWPWIIALIALAGGIFYLLRDRRARRDRYADFGRLAFAGPQPDAAADLPRKVPPAPAPIPANHPIPPRAVPVPPPAGDGLITSTRLKPELSVQFTPDRAVVTEHEVMLQYDMLIINAGSAPARDVLVEAKLVSAHAAQDEEIGIFFQQPAGPGDRMAAIPPLGRVSLKSAVRLPLDQVRDFEVEGRRLFVPMVAFNVHFRSSAGEGQASASFLVGRGGDEDEKLAPFRLDLGPRIFRGLSTRAHSMGLSR